ncbi:hypothetical protein EYZ11_000009 [Aspergillus tanneri]|uniref:DUF1754-domain-containing protein n=1 Tax=Aspergillus tanneri TaxID=1220188 RepID=A0A4S3JY10_9EURO|nr:uncharacterized protein ATNIH1004_000664 [Aspergillus tanneri]KAA8651768.1 hypothetical protein ATNIH1004_000664 [Aspergillus tanneri]THD00445.1 hypothetical protein EYZ11_000009 [Aspergillus tanneri]
MPPGSEYTSGGGGKLKLKGSKVSDGRVEKKKKKKAKKNHDSPDKDGDGPSHRELVGEETPSMSMSAPARDEIERVEEIGESVESSGGSVGKTEAERKYEDMRKKRLQERLKREGVKTHKERVEELNKYLSRLSEHHDMPKIGPG